MIGQYWKMCQADVCSCKGSGCKCASFAEIARQCDKGTFRLWKNWRTDTECPLPTCPGNQSYKECGPACIPSCTDPNPQRQSDQCVNTCVCPEGNVLDNIRGTNRCITKSACPCEYSGTIYQSGEIRNTSCQSCICERGKWSCSYRSCPGRCTIEEATYFTTFDNTYYSMIGDCSYYAVYTEDWNIKVEIHQCQAAFKQPCLQRVTLTKNQTNIVFSNDGKVYFDGNEVLIPLRTGEIIIFQQSSMYIQMATTFGLKMQVQILPIMQLYISLSEDAKGSTKGLCGTFNDDADDDFLSAQGIVESTPITFANSWKTEDHCSESTIPSPCISSENENYAKQHCSHLKDPAGAFSICHSTVDYMKFYQMCVAATCACENINDCLCAGLGAYVHECAAHGVIVRNWRKDICNKPCANTQVFENDMRACNRTCRSLSQYDYTCEVRDVPVYGCGCPEGKYMDNIGACIDKSDCSCYIGELVIKKGQSITLNGRICTCENGKPSCPIVPTTTRPGCPNGKVYNDCTNVIASKKNSANTCRSRNLPHSNSRCVPGCVCPDNLVEDDNGRCIAPEQCPCLYGGESHATGKSIQRDCNRCTCRAGKWQCTTNPCPKTCQVHGDGQYVTFDGKRYMFDGNCEYVFAEDYCNQGHGTFQILTESVPCCENGVTCSRNIKILLAGKEFILTDGRVVQTAKFGQTQCTDDSYSLHTVGLYLILTFSNGITVIWDKRTRVSITLDQRWKKKVCGLCGNFNDDVADDLTTKGNSLVTNAVKFGSSWKSSLSCSDIMNQTFPCDRNPYCLAWAQRKCSIIKDAVFQKCHKKVDPTPFHDACVQEACACDLEGKYLGFCTAVAVYAEACSRAGVCIDWRTPDLCPVYCDYYNTPGECSWHYRPCGTLTAKTCSDHYIGKKFSAILEGCYAKCPENAPYLDENKMKCVNLSECSCYYKGKILQPGERTRNDCEECECKNGKVTCIEETTTTTKWEITTTETTTPLIPTAAITTTGYIPEEECNGEWSGWFNENTPSVISPGDSELLDPIRDELCPSSSDAINKIQCQFADYPERPISESTDNVTCDKDTGLVCKFSESALSDRRFCYDYQIRVCCEPQIITEWTTTRLPETTSTTTIPETTPSTVRPTTTTSTNSYMPEEECNGEWSGWFNENTPSVISPGDSELLDPIRDELCPYSSDAINKIQCQFADYPERPISESTDNVTCDKDTGLICKFNESALSDRRFCYDYQIRVCCEPQIITEWTTTRLPETTSTTTIPEEECNGEWSGWFNENTPSVISPGDSELLDPIRDELCPYSSDAINKIQCQFADYPERPISESTDNVTCDKDTGLICKFNESALSDRRFCYDYQIRVCCEPQIITEWTTTRLPETTSTTTIPETTPSTVRPTTTTSTNSYMPEEECNGEWSGWFNENTPSVISPGDSELLDPIRDELCPYSSDAINKIQCQFADYPERPISESTDNVTCDKDTGLICKFNESALSDRRFCYDYQIRVCCEPQIITEWTTTRLPETTSTTTIPETAPPTVRPTTTTSTNSYMPETAPPTVRPTTTTSTNSYMPETTPAIQTTTITTSATSYTPESTTKAVTIPATEPFTTPGRYTTVTTTTSRPIRATTTELFCNGVWSPWFNENTPSIQNKGDSELLEPIRYKLCPYFPYQISDIDCEAVKFPHRPISETKDNVTCDIDKGLICDYNEQSPKKHLMCLDYRIRVCCEPKLTTQITSTTAIPIVKSTIYEPPIIPVTWGGLESCHCLTNPPKKCGETWKENCTAFTCIKGDMFKMEPIVCPALIKPTCNNNIEPVKIRTANGCCEKWECDCECEIWGDPHYRTFDGLWYDFFENCTYTLVEERVPRYHFSVLVDNYFCFPFIKKSCPKGLTISYNGTVVRISTGETYVLTINGADVSLPYSANGFKMTKLGISTYISIPDIQTSIIAFRNTFKIRVPEQYFLNNTQGQCGSCSHSPPQCIRKSGKVEPSDCCHKTAYDWRVDDPNKPYCQSASTNLPCTPVPPPPTCKPEETICNVIQRKPFEQCRRKINLDKYINTCLFDHCQLNSTVDCSSLESAALACASIGKCVDWRPFTNGLCNYTCDQGLVYKPCQSKKDNQCKNDSVIAGEILVPAEEGCFCPDGMILSEEKSKCVASCQVCRDRLGQPRKEGDTWEDANNPCLSYECTEYGVVIRNKSCNQDESCPKPYRVYIDRCCFTCRPVQGLCKVNKFNETIRRGQCETIFETTQCQGHCSSATRYNFKRNRMNHYCQCCHEYKTEKVSVNLRCKNGKSKTVKYTNIKSCICKDCENGD
ncbi:mucin-5AC-like [Cetorhinus maximus]